MKWIIVNQSELYTEGIMDTTKSHPPSTDRRDANDSHLHRDKQRRLFYLFSDGGTTDALLKCKRRSTTQLGYAPSPLEPAVPNTGRGPAPAEGRRAGMERRGGSNCVWILIMYIWIALLLPLC